jgi:hypothetical protein
MSNENFVFVQALKRPRRKLILKRAYKANNYYEHGNEVGFHFWKILCDIKGALYEPAGFWLPDQLKPQDTSKYVMGVEVPLDYSGSVPEQMEMIDLEECTYLVFQGQKFLPDMLNVAISDLEKAIESFTPEAYGWEWLNESAPKIEYDPLPERGCILARPVRTLISDKGEDYGEK